MLDAARTIQDFTTGVSLKDYLLDRKVQLAVERAIEIIGEAARLVSPDLKAQHPEIPWRQIVAQRNVLAHDYGEIKQDRIGWWLPNAFRGLSLNFSGCCRPWTLAPDARINQDRRCG